MKIVNTDNYGSDYPDESFVDLPPLTKELAEAVVDAINDAWGGNHAPRFWKVVENNYKLQPGFRPIEP